MATILVMNFSSLANGMWWCNAHKSSIQAKNDATKNHRLNRKGPFHPPLITRM